MPVIARVLELAARPQGRPKPSDFRMVTTTLPDPGPGEVLLQTLYLSLDPYMRGRMSPGPSYAAPTEIGQPLPSEAVARVLMSGDPAFQPGDVVVVYDAWRDHTLRRARECRKLNPAQAPVQTALGVMGMPGLTA